jgi:large subunit ribosomal protein L15
MNLSNLRAPKKANSNKKRVGRGMGSGMGKTSTRGHKGQGSRSGSSLMRGFEGGQMPLHRRLPKRGFTNIFKTEYEVVNIERLASLKETEITPDVLRKAGVVSVKNSLVKVLGQGEVAKAITVSAHKFSKSAQEKIEKAGGKITRL